MAYVVPAEVIFSVMGFFAVIIVYGVLAIGRIRERLSKLEEWARLMEKRLNGDR